MWFWTFIFLLADGSQVNPSLKDFLNSLGLPTTVTLADGTGTPLRVYSHVGTRMIRELKKQEDALQPQDFPSYRERLQVVLQGRGISPDSEEMLLPMSEDIGTGKVLAGAHGNAGAIVAVFGQAMAGIGHAWPFCEGSSLCRDHGTRFPIVQGPMAHVSDNPNFLAAVAAGGALPFLAMGNMPGPIAREGIGLAGEKTNGRFGVGLIGLELNRHCYEAHLEIMRDNPPPFAILAAGSIDLAKSIEDIGTACYLHCPSPSILSEGLKAGLRRFVFEGCESGGHIGTLGSLNLWNANLNALEAAAAQGVDLSEVSVLFAGGIADRPGRSFRSRDGGGPCRKRSQSGPADRDSVSCRQRSGFHVRYHVHISETNLAERPYRSYRADRKHQRHALRALLWPRSSSRGNKSDFEWACPSASTKLYKKITWGPSGSPRRGAPLIRRQPPGIARCSVICLLKSNLTRPVLDGTGGLSS